MRTFFQIHLSTALLCMMLTGAFLGLNIRTQKRELIGYIPGGTVFMHGWPLPFAERTQSFSPWKGDTFSAWKWNIQNLLVDSVLFIGALSTACFANEWRVRRAVKADTAVQRSRSGE